MNKIRLGQDEYRDRMLGCWLGKNIGGTLGTPVEGQKFVHSFTYYDPVPKEPLPNDDLDFQLVWLKMLEDRGVNPGFEDFSDYWLKHLSGHWYSEYSFCTYNLQRGLTPPISGAFQNYFVDEMGSPIRSEIWACVAPGDPQLAAKMAWMDSAMDHAGGEGTWGEMFWSAVESAAFVISDPELLIGIGLSMIPLSSHISRVIREAVRCHKEGLRWDEARERIVTIFGHYNACNAIPNHGFTVIGWLYGKDYGDRICKAVNCGYDTDCSGATLGSLLGIIGGASKIPQEWRSPIGDAIKPVKFTVTDGLPLTVEDLANRTEVLAKSFVAQRSETVEFSDHTEEPAGVLSLLFNNEKVRSLTGFDSQSSVRNVGDFQVAFHYGGEPVLKPRIGRVLGVSLWRDWEPVDIAEAETSINVPTGWKVEPATQRGNQRRFSVVADKIQDRSAIDVAVGVHGKS
ncbi:MAG TPA: ADP-ribosylglycohydrolase family protein, partial [Thermoproteota archaeon]|nr:ADP-ribosylglycohydrolase family protein [Thermoproteota archaeon]